MTDTFFRNAQIGIFNPGRLTDAEIEQTFITRTGVFKYLFEKITSEGTGSIPQHYIVIGQRGMGKSTLLHRVAVELRKPPHNQVFIPLTYPEEQYNIDRLSKFWLNSLDALGDALDKEGNLKELAELDSNVRTWANNAKHITSSEMYQHFEDWCQRIGRRAILLVDNLNLIFDRISKEEQHELRAILMENNAPILLGASTTTIEDTIQYGAPFYDAFQMTYLKKLSFEETLDILRNLAKISDNQRFLNSFMAYKGRLHALYTLTGGTPRTLTMLYPLIQDGFSIDVQNDLEGLMDIATPLYKARFEELPPQMQVIVDAVALHWDPIHLKDLRTATQLENAQLAPQLKRLIEAGWLEKQDAYQEKGNAYEISERFFNIWYLMRRSSRRQKKELLCLTKFLMTLYGEELPQMGRSALGKKSKNADQVSLNLALADGITDQDLAEKIREKSYHELWEMAKTNKRILSDFAIPETFLSKKEDELFNKAFIFYYNSQFDKALEIFLEITDLNPKCVSAWYHIGAIYYDHFQKTEKAKFAFEKAIGIDNEDAFSWNGLGNVFQEDPSKYLEAEKAYYKSIKFNETFFQPWNGLGTLYHCHLSKFKDAEEAYKKAIQLAPNESFVWKNLGILYFQSLHRYNDAENAFKRAIELNSHFNYLWNNLGNFYQDEANRFEDAEEAYKKAIEFEDVSMVNLNLVFLYRDKMNRMEDAKAIFKTLKPEGELVDSYWLNDALFAFYDQNIGIAKQSFQKALEQIHGELPDNTQDDWWRFAAVAHKLGHTQAILDTMKERGFDIQLRPYYVAIEALSVKNGDAFLKSKAVEIREAAALILEKIKKYQ